MSYFHFFFLAILFQLTLQITLQSNIVLIEIVLKNNVNDPNKKIKNKIKIEHSDLQCEVSTYVGFVQDKLKNSSLQQIDFTV